MARRTRQTNPLVAILGWFDALPREEVQRTVAFLVTNRLSDIIGHLSEAERLVLVSDIKGDLVPKLRDWLQPKEPQEDVAKALLFRALVDYQCHNLFSDAGWENFSEGQSEIREQAVAENIDAVADAAGEMIQRVPFRRALWLKTAQSWKVLCADHLSYSALKLFEN
jgi:hypothetical protein